MRATFWLTAAACLAVTTALAAAEKYPYTAYVAVEEAEIFSGPGAKFYATQRLPRDMAVEVYARDSQGWLAIRPPDACFSWVPADHVAETDDPNVGEVVAPSHSWIGTDVQHVQEHKFQVRLPVGELVEILDERLVETEAGEEYWLKIAPPAGEFRWIPARSVTSSPPRQKREIETVSHADEQETDDKPAASTDEPAEPRRSTPAIALRDLRNDGSLADRDSSVRPTQFTKSTPNDTPANSRLGDPKVLGDGFVPRKPRKLEPTTSIPDSRTASSSPAASVASRATRSDVPSSAKLSSPATPDLLPSRGPLGLGGPSSTGGVIPSAEVAREVEQLDVDLSLLLAQPRGTWNLEALRARADAIVERGETPSDRGYGRMMLDKIEQVADTFAITPESAGPSGYAAVTKAAADPRYDGQGWLQPIRSRQHNTDYLFALVDEQGNPLCFISPSPGINLSHYVNKQVGVYGRRGYIETLKSPHIVAERIVSLDRVR